MESARTLAQCAPYTSVHDSFYIPYLDPPPTVYAIDETNPTLQQILDDVWTLYDPLLARSYDPRQTYRDQIRQITMDSLCRNGRIIGGRHHLPPKPIISRDVDMEILNPWNVSLPVNRPSVAACRHGEGIGIDPLETIGVKDIPSWRRRDKPKKLKGKKCSSPIPKKRKAPRKRKAA